MKRIYVLLTVVLFSLVLSSVTSVIASEGLGHPENNQKACTGTWKFPTLYVGGKDGVVFAEAAYEFDENCNPVLFSETRLTSVPSWVTNPSQQPVDEKTVEASEIRRQNYIDEGGSILAVDTCHIRTFEEDIIYLDMIAVQTDQTYSWDNVKVTLSGGSTTATTYYPWWYRSSGPHASNGTYSGSVVPGGRVGYRVWK